MANLTKNVGTVTLTGTAEKVTLPAAYGWVWVKNMSEGDIFAGLSEDISEGADGVMVIPSGECGRIQTDGFLSVYLLGSGNVQIVGQNYADCPFKAGAKGGGLPVASTDTLGGVMVDGTSITANEQGVISAVGGGGLTLVGTYNLETNYELGTLNDLPRGTRLLFEHAPASGTSLVQSSVYRMIPGYVPSNDDDVVIVHGLIPPHTSSGIPSFLSIYTSNNKVYASTTYGIKKWNMYKLEV